MANASIMIAWTPELRKQFIDDIRSKSADMLDPEYHLAEWAELLGLETLPDDTWKISMRDLAAILLLGAVLNEVR